MAQFGNFGNNFGRPGSGGPGGFGGGHMLFGRPWTPAVKFLIITTVIVYILQIAITPLTDWLLLRFDPTAPNFKDVYRFFTYMLLHSPDHLSHLFLNMIGLFLIGPTIEEVLGRKGFLWLYFLGGLGGAILTVALPPYPTLSLGASGAIFAIMGAFAILFWESSVLLFLIIPVRTKTLMYFLIGVNLFIGITGSGNMDAWCHLGGMATGFVLVKYNLLNRLVAFSDSIAGYSENMKTKYRQQQTKRAFESEINEKEKVDMLLEKIGKHGMHTLSDDERNFLTEFSRKQAQKRDNR